jgi:hypothetical protein
MDGVRRRSSASDACTQLDSLGLAQHCAAQPTPLEIYFGLHADGLVLMT